MFLYLKLVPYFRILNEKSVLKTSGFHFGNKIKRAQNETYIFLLLNYKI